MIKLLETDGPSTTHTTTHEDEEEEEVVKIIHPTSDNADGTLNTEELSPLFALFPDLITTFPTSLQSGISTTDLTKELVSLGRKADFSRLKPASRLIPPQKVWLSALHEVPRELEKMEEVEEVDEVDDATTSYESLNRRFELLDDKGLSLGSSTSF